MKVIKSVKQAFENDDVIITKIIQGNRNNVRIDAKTRFHIADKENFFSEWVSLKYANRLALENYGKKVHQFKVFHF
jgi:hypothetical protein